MSDTSSNEPIIYTRGEKVALGPLRDEHKEIFLRYMQDPEVAIHASGSFRARSFESLDGLWDMVSKTHHNFCIYDRESMRMIGTAVLHKVDQTNGTALFGHR